VNPGFLGVALWTGAGFLAGSLMFSYWLGRLFAKKDVREYGDANPGAFNAWKAGGWKIGLAAALLDFAKGAVPVGLAVWVFGVGGWYVVPVALAPILGHAFSPFLKFRGGKAIAVSLGVWSALTIWEGLLVFGLLIGLFYILLDHPSWSVIFAMLAFLGYMILLGVLLRGVEIPLLAVWTGNMLVFLHKHRLALREAIKPRPYVARFFRRTS